MEIVNGGNRSPYWDIVKGLGILSIVLGHCSATAHDFVYSYHLALFFFVSGYFYSEKKYGTAPLLNIWHRIKGNWPKFVFYMGVFVLLHNFFINIGFYYGLPYYGPTDIFKQLINVVLFRGNENMGNAFGFIPNLIVASAIFGILVWLSNILSSCLSKPRFKVYILLTFTVIFGITGVVLFFKEISLPYRMHTAILVIPIYFAAYAARKYITDLKKYLKWYVAVFCAAGIVVGTVLFQVKIELSRGMIDQGYSFYLLAFLGIYLCLYLAKITENRKINLLSRLFVFFGKYSFDIMALHFLMFKIIDLIYGKFILRVDLQTYSKFPTAFSDDLWWAYLCLGMVGSAGIGVLVTMGQKKLTSLFRFHKL